MKRALPALIVVFSLAACSDGSGPSPCDPRDGPIAEIFISAIQVTPLDRTSKKVGVTDLTGSVQIGDSIYALNAQTNTEGRVVRLQLNRVVGAGDYTVQLTRPGRQFVWSQSGTLLKRDACSVHPVELAAWF